MDGITDAAMRALQGETGAFSFAVSEFLRISQEVPPQRLFHRHVPELLHGGRTSSGLPVQVQILGGDAGRMAGAAVTAWQAGAKAIDINFGCPARTVNRHDGGATLLQYPKRIREIVRAVREALPVEVAVSAKMRLGWESIEDIHENAEMAAEGGADWLTIHARTREQCYAPPVYWKPIGIVRERLNLPVVANGDIWTLEDFRRCREETGCRHFMLGRGALADPRLPLQIARELGLVSAIPEDNGPEIDWRPPFRRLIEWMHCFGEHRRDRALFRLKQWLRIAAHSGSFTRFEQIKTANSTEELFAMLDRFASDPAADFTPLHLPGRVMLLPNEERENVMDSCCEEALCVSPI